MVETTGIFKKLVVLLRFLCVCVREFIIYCMSANILCCSSAEIDSLVISTKSVCSNGRSSLFIIIWLFIVPHRVISEMDGSCRCCGDSHSVTLYTLPVHTEPETIPSAFSCSTVVHWHCIPPGVLYICSWNVLLVQITVKANIILSYCILHLTAVSHCLTPWWFT